MKAVSKEVKKVVDAMLSVAECPQKNVEEIVVQQVDNPSNDCMRDDAGGLRGWFMSKMFTKEDGSKELEVGIKGNSFFIGEVQRGDQLVDALFVVHKNLSKDKYGKLSVWEYAEPIRNMHHARNVIMSLASRQRRPDSRGKCEGRFFFATNEYEVIPETSDPDCEKLVGIPIWKMNRSFIPSTETFQKEIVDMFADRAVQLCKDFDMLAPTTPEPGVVDPQCSVFTRQAYIITANEHGEVISKELRYV